MYFFRVAPWVVLLATVSVIGCGSGGDSGAKNRKKTVPVTGVVTFNGAPVEGATVTFSPGTGSTSKAAFGATDASGTYRLTTYALNDGAIPGSYFVTIAKQVVAERQPDPVDEKDYRPPEETEGKAPPKNSMTVLPPKYASPTTSGLKAEVKDDGSQTFDFKLAP